MEKNVLYIVHWSNPKYDDVDYRIFADKEKAIRKFNEWKEFFKGNYIDHEEDEDREDLFRRFDYNYGNSMPFVTIDKLAYTNDNKKILIED